MPRMSDLHFYDEGEDLPLPRPKAEVRFTDASLLPLADGRRVKLHFALTPFAERPSVEMTVTNASGREVATMSLIEAMDTDFDFTVHLRGPQPQGEHTLRLTMFYLEGDDPDAPRQIVDERDLIFTAVSPF